MCVGATAKGERPEKLSNYRFIGVVWPAIESLIWFGFVLDSGRGVVGVRIVRHCRRGWWAGSFQLVVWGVRYVWLGLGFCASDIIASVRPEKNGRRVCAFEWSGGAMEYGWMD